MICIGTDKGRVSHKPYRIRHVDCPTQRVNTRHKRPTHFWTEMRYVAARQTHRWPLVTQQTPVHFGKPFMLLNFTGSTSAAKPSSFIFVEQPNDDILASAVRQGLSLKFTHGSVSNSSPPRNFRCIPEMNWHRSDVGKSIVPLLPLEGRGGELHKSVNGFSHSKIRSKLRR